MSKQVKDNFLVLVADDSEDDRFLLKKAMQRAPRLKIIGEVAHGGDVINYFKGHAHFNDREKFPLPDLLLLDLKMPHLDGFEVLAWLRTRSFKELTVVVLTDSMQVDHIKRALDLGADLFQVKPRLPHDLATMILALEERLLLPGKVRARSLHLSALASLW